MSGSLNVNGSDDPSYRYKMPKLVAKIEGRGNGIKTVIVNCSDIADSLGRPTAQVTKFFGCELGAQSKYDEKNDKAIVNGSFETSDLQRMIFKFIEKFVLCPSCGNPETNQSVKGKKKSATIHLTCQACGITDEADNTHKLCTFIIKELTALKESSKKDKDSQDGKKSKKEKKEKKEKKKKSKDDDEKKKKKKEKKEKKRREREAAGGSGSDSDSDPAATLENMSIDDRAAIDMSISRLQRFLAEGTRSPGEITTEVENLQINSGLPISARIKVLYLATVMENPVSALEKFVDVFGALILGSPNGQIDMLRAMEECVEMADAESDKRATLVTATPLVIKSMYDSELVDETVIISWYTATDDFTQGGVSSTVIKAIKEKAKPIVEWLMQDDDSSDDSSDEDDE